ncbi:MAG: hypothetical protein K2L38_11055 [Dysosmobacter sp.]|nr:hypothetical protein [Dysosmobacter sp.]
MISSFYYLAAYTAAAAAGFSERDSAAIARAARYTEDCAGLTAPEDGDGPESPLSQLLELAVFHYLPGNAEDILRGVNAAFYEGPGAASAPMLPLVCRPDGRLYAAAAEYACKGMAPADCPRRRRFSGPASSATFWRPPTCTRASSALRVRQSTASPA